MRKAIFIYSLFTLGYLGFSTVPVTEVNAAETIALTSGSNQSTTRGGTFSNAVKFTVTDNGAAVQNKQVFITRKDDGSKSLKISSTGANGTFIDLSGSFITTTTNNIGQVTVHIMVKESTLYDTVGISAGINVTQPTKSIATFTGTITDVLNFSTDRTTRSVAEGTAANTNIGAAVSATHWRNADTDMTNDVTLTYSLEGTHGASFDIDTTTGQLRTRAALGAAGTSYSVTVKVEEKDGTTVRSSDTIDVAITVTAITVTEGPITVTEGPITVTDVDESPPSQNPSVNPQTPAETKPATKQPPQRGLIRKPCPVGWVRNDGFGGRTPRVLLYEVKLAMDLHSRVSIYKPVSVAIYVHPDEGLQTLDGWKLQVAFPYNHHRAYPLTAENSVVVDSKVEGVEGGFAFIKNPEETPFPMAGMGLRESLVPGFDYRLYDDKGRRVDFGIACYQRLDISQVLKGMEEPSVLRQVDLETFDWDAPYIRSEWTVPVSVGLPASTVPETSDLPASTVPETSTMGSTLSILPASVVSPAIGKPLAINLNIEGGEAVAGYQASLQFDTSALRYVSSANGDYLPAGAFFVEPVVEGNLVKLIAASLTGEANGNGTLATLTFEVIAVKASTLTLVDVLLSNAAGAIFAPQLENAQITKPTIRKGDVNGDGTVNTADLVLIASNFGKTGQNAADVNSDGVVNIADFVLVAGVVDTKAAAPSLFSQSVSTLTVADVRLWLSQAQHLTLTDATSQRGLLFLEQLLVTLIPKETALLANYPNPFNPETWIPYQLAKDADVTLRIYAVNGRLVRTLALGHQAAGMYQNRSRAAYWDGRNAFGEPVVSGVYFYTFTAGDFTATRKMLIRK